MVTKVLITTMMPCIFTFMFAGDITIDCQGEMSHHQSCTELPLNLKPAAGQLCFSRESKASLCNESLLLKRITVNFHIENVH